MNIRKLWAEVSKIKGHLLSPAFIFAVLQGTSLSKSTPLTQHPAAKSIHIISCDRNKKSASMEN